MFGVVAISGIGYYIYKNDVWVKSKLFDIGWNLTKLASKCSDKMGIDLGENYNVKKTDSDDEDDEDDEEGEEMMPLETDYLLNENKCEEKKSKLIKKKFKYYSVKKNKSYSLSLKDEHLLKDERENIDLLFLKIVLKNLDDKNDKKEKYYYRLNVNDVNTDLNLNERKTEKQFLQIELVDLETNVVTDIHHNLNSFYLIGNKILDEVFLKWYLDYFYNLELPDNYKLQIFDKNVNMFSINKENSIVLTEKAYKVEIEN
tara:strand:- start:5567 stop:6340 length:774 start_codon:yes stop_codon:yes gene_type:complete